MKLLSFILITVSLGFCSTSRPPSQSHAAAGEQQIKTGADQTEKYLPYLKGKRVAILANPTSVIGKTHLVDSFRSRAWFSWQCQRRHKSGR
jgi:uncharacterized protein YbbC (DUF1343 family)